MNGYRFVECVLFLVFGMVIGVALRASAWYAFALLLAVIFAVMFARIDFRAYKEEA